MKCIEYQKIWYWAIFDANSREACRVIATVSFAYLIDKRVVGCRSLLLSRLWPCVKCSAPCMVGMDVYGSYIENPTESLAAELTEPEWALRQVRPISHTRTPT